MDPGYFALVMASGIISVGMYVRGFGAVSDAFFALATGAYGVLTIGTVWRVASHRAAMADDLHDPSRGFGFFTFVAATNVLGVRCAMAELPRVALVLLLVATASWLVLGYLVPWTAVLGSAERPALARANGTWFVWVVASQSIAVSAATLEPVFAHRALALLALFSWSVGVVLYVVAGVFVVARLLLYPITPEGLTPAYWVAMGAAAITVLAGSRIAMMTDTPTTALMGGLAGGVSAVLWAFATWLFPPLLAAGWWRHVVHRDPLRYEPGLWSMVFPLGMYAVASLTLHMAEGLGVVGAVGAVELWFSVAVWLVVFAGMLVPRSRGPVEATTTERGARP
nr:tellurite resistance/C4-dicarboxylate transporter family protein [Rhodococcus sp. HNM0569]